MTSNLAPRGDTERAFLDAAERLFAERGYEGAKVRAIAEAAGANIGALHYYWGGKEELFRAVWGRRMDSLQAGRERRLQACRAKVREGGITVEDVLTVMIETGIGVADWSERSSEQFQKLYGRALHDPSPVVREIVAQHFDRNAASFLELIRIACPGLDEQRLHWALHAVFGAILNIHVGGGRVNRLVPRPAGDKSLADGAEYIVRFLAAGFRELSHDL